MPPSPPSAIRRVRGPALLALAIVAVAAAGLALWVGYLRSPAEPPPAPVAIAPVPVAPAAPPAPVVKHPIEAVPVEPTPSTEPLPPRARSDAALVAAAAALAGAGPLARFFFTDELVRRFVITVDNLPRETLPMQLRVVKATPGAFATTGAGSERAIAPDNALRYAPFVGFVEGVDTRRLVAGYLRFYPLLQEEFRSIGFPDRQFNDRVVEAIDDLLAAPERDGPVALVQPKVTYRYADPELEALSAGRRIMLRIGTENARRIKAKLREIRGLLAAPAAPGR